MRWRIASMVPSSEGVLSMLMQPFADHAAGDVAIAIAAHSVCDAPDAVRADLHESILIRRAHAAGVGRAFRDVDRMNVFLDQRVFEQGVPRLAALTYRDRGPIPAAVPTVPRTPWRRRRRTVSGTRPAHPFARSEYLSRYRSQ